MQPFTGQPATQERKVQNQGDPVNDRVNFGLWAESSIQLGEKIIGGKGKSPQTRTRKYIGGNTGSV